MCNDHSYNSSYAPAPEGDGSTKGVAVDEGKFMVSRSGFCGKRFDDVFDNSVRNVQLSKRPHRPVLWLFISLIPFLAVFLVFFEPIAFFSYCAAC